jgi:hypothetical protein
LGAAAALVGLLLGLPARQALAADPQLSLVVTQRWQLANTQGTWTPYVVTVRDEGSTGFTGDVFLVPNDSRTVTPDTYPSYRSPVSVGRGGQRSAVFYVVDSPGGYTAELRDGSGRTVARADLANAARSTSAVAILSDLTQAEQKIAAPLRSLSRVDSSLFRFASAQEFPTNAVYLSGLSGLIIDQFDSAALSQAQAQTLKDFVGLGGTLIEAGGPSWRRTLLSLPPELLPMRPSSTGTASLVPLAELGGVSTDASAQVASGRVAFGRVTLAAPDGQPLVVEGGYGAGRVIELAFDPFAGPFDTQVNLAGMAWSHAINRALSAVQGGTRTVQSGFGVASGITTNGSGAAGPGSWAPGYYSSGNDQLYTILQDTPATTAPPVGLLGGLLVAYVLLAGLLNYLFLRAAGRRTLMWVSVPVVALVFTGGAYLVGFGTRGSDFLVTEAQVQRLGPEGTVESYSFDGVYPPRKGDVTLTLPANTLVSTAVSASPLGDSRRDALITSGPRPQVLLSNVAVWNMRPVQTLAVTHPYAYEPHAAMPVDVQLTEQKGHVVGRVANLGSRPIRDLELISSSGTEAPLIANLAPGAAATVDVELNPGPGAPSAPSKEASQPIPGVSDSSRAAMVRLAATQATSGRPGELAVVGFTQATGSIRVDGARPGRLAVAAVVEPIQLQAADSLAGIAPRPRLVSNFLPTTGDSDQVDVYDFDLPLGLTSAVGLSYQLLDGSPSTVRSVEVYDWSTGSWRALPKQQVPVKTTGPTPLAPGELAQGVVRVRVDETSPFQASLAVSDQSS